MKRFLFILIIGGIGGVLLNNFLLPVLIEADFLGTANFLKIFVKPQVQTVIKETERTVVVEPDFWKEVVAKTEKSIVFVQYFATPGTLLSQSSGIILTNDGLIVVPLNTVPRSFSKIQVFAEDKILAGELVTVDAVNILALVKIEAKNLPILDFAEINDISLGQNFIIIGKKIKINKINNFVQNALVREIEGEIIFLDTQSGRLFGAAAINSKGKLAGMTQINNRGQIFVLPSGILRNLIDEYLNRTRIQ